MRAGRLNFRELADEIFEWLERKVFGSPTWRDMYFAEKAKREETERRLDHFRGIKR